MTPRKLLALWDRHCEFKGWKTPITKQKIKTGFIDQVL